MAIEGLTREAVDLVYLAVVSEHAALANVYRDAAAASERTIAKALAAAPAAVAAQAG